MEIDRKRMMTERRLARGRRLPVLPQQTFVLLHDRKIPTLVFDVATEQQSFWGDVRHSQGRKENVHASARHRKRVGIS